MKPNILSFYCKPTTPNMYKFCILACLCLFHSVSFSQIPIDIAENTVKVSSISDEVFYYGFAEGDQLVFNFEEVNGKELKEIEIMFMPSQSIFMDYKTKKIVNKTIQII